MIKSPSENDDYPLLPTDLARQLIDALGSTLVASLIGARLGSAPQVWANDSATADSTTAKRLRFADEQWRRVSSYDGDSVARAWFIGANPWLKDSTPVTAIREGRFSEVSSAVQAFLEDSRDS